MQNYKIIYHNINFLVVTNWTRNNAMNYPATEKRTIEYNIMSCLHKLDGKHGNCLSSLKPFGSKNDFHMEETFY